MKKLLFILSIFIISIGATSFAPPKKTMAISLSAVANADDTHTISWDASVDAPPHTLLVYFYYGKKRSQANYAWGLYAWAHWNPYNGQIELSGSRKIDLWTYGNNPIVTVEAYVCQFTGPEADQYEIIYATPLQIKKR